MLFALLRNLTLTSLLLGNHVPATLYLDINLANVPNHLPDLFKPLGRLFRYRGFRSLRVGGESRNRTSASLTLCTTTMQTPQIMVLPRRVELPVRAYKARPQAVEDKEDKKFGRG